MSRRIGFRTLLDLRLGGFQDTVALAAAFGGGMLANPALSNVPGGMYLGMGLTAAGIATLFSRMDALVDKRMYHSDVFINSDDAHLIERATADIKSGLWDGMLLGYTVDSGKPVVISWDDWMRHAFIVGQSGMGKTVFGEWVMFQQIMRGGGILWIDGKVDASNIRKLDAMCAYAGRRDDLRVINPGNPDFSNTYNPILYGDPDEVASRVLSLIPSTESNAGADFYKQKSNQGMTTLVAAIQAARLAYSFGDIAILLQNEKALDYLTKLLPLSTDAGRQLALFIESLKTVDRQGQRVIDIKKINDLFGGLGGRMHMFGSLNFGRVTNTYAPEVDLYDSVRRNQIVYLPLPTMGKNEAASNFGKMAIGDFRSAIAKIQDLPVPQRPWPPFLGFFDEAGSYVTPAWSRMFEQSRSAQLVMMPAIQTIANLDAVSDELREMVLGNTVIKASFRVGTQETAEHVTNFFGTERVASVSVSMGRGGGVSAAAGTGQKQAVNDASNASYSEKLEEVQRVTINDLKTLEKGECVVSVGGGSVYHIKVPRLEFSQAFLDEIGQPQINHAKRKFARGLNLYAEAHRWLS